MTTHSQVQSAYKMRSFQEVLKCNTSLSTVDLGRRLGGPATAGVLLRLTPSVPPPPDLYLNLDASEPGRILPGWGQDQILFYTGPETFRGHSPAT